MTEPQPPALTRREAIAGAGVALAGLSLGTTLGTTLGATPSLAQPATASGVVFDDADATGQRRAISNGVPGVMVSNGQDVTLTDADGRWSLPVAEGEAVFVIKPSGWTTPVDPATQLPRFSHLHVPGGTPETLGLRFAGIPPTGPLPASIDFPLRRQTESPRFNAILFTDPQPESLVELGYVRDDMVAQASGTEAAFGITHGDLMFDDLSFYPRYNAILGSIGLPWYSCPGNHDINYEAPDDTHSRETFKRVFGARNLAFQYGGATFFVLDNVEYLGTDPSRTNRDGKYRGSFGPRTLAFVRNVLAHVPRDALVVFSFHIPLRTLQGAGPGTANTDTRAFLEAISTHSNSVSFSGHTHTNEHWYFAAPEGFAAGTHHHHVLAAVSGSWWSGPFDHRGIPVALQSDGSPNGMHILEVDANRYTTTLVPAHDPAQGQMRIVLDSQVHRGGREVMRDYRPGALLGGPIAADAVASTTLVVNLFDGGPRSRVEFRAGRTGGFTAMQKTERLDPFVEEVYARNADTKKPWVNPARSSHIWQARLPAALGLGTHRITVRATDEFGRTHTGAMVLEITS